MQVEERENEYRFKFGSKEEMKILTRKLLELLSNSERGQGPYFLSLAKESLPVWSDEAKRMYEKTHFKEEDDEN